MPRFAAESLDLSRLPLPQAIRTLDYEVLLARRRVGLKAAFDLANIPYDAERLDSDPAMQLQQVDAYRELISYAQINAAVRATMAAFAKGADLEHIAIRYGIVRMDGEDDDRLRWRVMLAPETWGVGKLAGYLQGALTANALVRDAGVWVDRSDPAQPIVRIAPMVDAGDGTPPDDVLDGVRIFLNQDNVKGATHVLAIQRPIIKPYALSAVVVHPRGPDPAVLRQLSTAGLTRLAADRHRPGRSILLPAVTAAALPAAAETVRILEPTAPIVAGPGDLTHCLGVTVTTEALVA